MRIDSHDFYLLNTTGTLRTQSFMRQLGGLFDYHVNPHRNGTSHSNCNLDSHTRSYQYNTECGEEKREYYSLRGYGEQGPNKTCIDLKNLPQLSDTSESCRFFTGGGTSWGDCSEATFDNPTSFVIRNGFCTPYPEEGCQGDSDGSLNPGITDGSHPGCTNIEPQFALPDTWRSMKCAASLSQD
ncbi:hypothetical protein DL770_005853 [Monosporascus sp. CRB-9-2]|nr:hypothetical protein DL770_005853 [Monosporascus sp. CRB-9-2]